MCDFVNIKILGMFRIFTSHLIQPIWLELKLILKILISDYKLFLQKWHFYKWESANKNSSNSSRCLWELIQLPKIQSRRVQTNLVPFLTIADCIKNLKKAKSPIPPVLVGTHFLVPNDTHFLACVSLISQALLFACSRFFSLRVSQSSTLISQ